MLMKLGKIDNPSLETERVGHWESFGAFCLDKDIVRRDRVVLGFINMSVLLQLMHQAMEKKGYDKLPKLIDELEDSAAFNSILDLKDEPFDRLRQQVGEVYRLSTQLHRRRS